MAGALTAAIAAIYGASAVITDPYFEYTTLLLPGNGTNGAQNNTFLDASTNNFTITRNGNTTQGTFSPFSQTGWGNYFSGSSQYLSVAANAAFNYGSGDFTIEAWVNLSSTSSNFQIYASTTGGYSSPEFIWIYNSTQGLRFYAHSGTYDIKQGSISGWSAGTWYHVALVRNGTTVTLYKDGVSVASGSVSTASFGSSTSTQAIAASVSEATYATGYISNLRVVKGVVVYTGAFTPPTSPLTATQSAGTNISAITGTQTSLLTCQSNRFRDASSNNFAATINGSPSVQAFSPFNPTASWSATTNGGSGYFDGNSDYLRTTGSALAVGSGTFTYEAWVYPTSISATISGIFDSRIYTGSAGTNGIGLFLTSGGEVRIDNSAGAILTTSGAAITVNSWVHIAVEKSGGNLIIYVNGVSKGSVANSATYSSTEISIGTSFSNSWPLTGYISSFRLVTSAVYGGAFTPPTAPLTNITNTSLLLNFTNAGIYDATSKNDLETVGNAQISNTTAKWGSTSIKFDGTGDWLLAPSSQNCVFGTGNFTVEFWIYPTQLTASIDYNIIDFRNASDTTSFRIGINGSTVPFVANTGGILGGSFTFSTNTWYYMAVTRNNGTLTIWVNGSNVGSNTTTTNFTGAIVTVGASANPAVRGPFFGYMQDLRVTLGYARTITTPTAAFPTL